MTPEDADYVYWKLKESDNLAKASMSNANEAETLISNCSTQAAEVKIAKASALAVRAMVSHAQASLILGMSVTKKLSDDTKPLIDAFDDVKPPKNTDPNRPDIPF